MGESGKGEPARTDAELMIAFGAGDEASFDEIFARHHRRVFNYLLRRTGNRATAEDLLQATFVRLIEARRRYEPTAALATWIYTIATNLSRDHARRSAVRDAAAADTPTARDGRAGPAAEVEASRAELRRSIESAVRALPEHEREALILGKFEGFSYDEIAGILGISVAAVKVRIHRAMKTLRTGLGEWLR